MLARLIYARGRSPASALIRIWPDSAPARWSHCGILIGEEVWEARFGRGFHATPLAAFVDRYEQTEVVSYDVAEHATELWQWSWCKHRDGQRYATGTVLGRLFGWRNSEQRADHCSEVAENFLAACGLQRWRGALHLVTPNASFHNTCGVIA